MTSTYWNRKARMSRRGFLISSGAASAGLAAVGLVGCGDDDDVEGLKDVPGIANTPTAGASPSATEAVKHGGVWRGAIPTDIASLDPLSGSSYTLSLYGSYVYSRLVRNETGPGIDPNEFRTKLDLAASVEITEPLTYVVKLNPKGKFHDPISRPVDAEDVVSSWERQKASAAGLVNDIANVEATSADTVTFTLTAPNSQFLDTSKSVFIMPKEAGTAFDPAQRMVGTGPWIFEQYVPGTVLKFRRNPEWHLGPDAPYMDAVELSIVPEYATRLSQFMGGNIDELDVQGNDIPQVVNSVEGLQIYRGELQLPWSYMSFSGNPADANAPWRDPRVRRAISMAMDRDELTEAAYNVSRIRQAIPDLEVHWNNIVPQSTRPFWLDPKGEYSFDPGDPKISDEGATAFRYDPQAAKQLLEAAGYANGFQVEGGGFIYPIARYGEPFRIISELVLQYLARLGMNFPTLPQDYQSAFAPTSLLGDFKGMIHVAGGGGYPLFNSFELYYLPGAVRNNGRIDDPELADRIRKVAASFDREERRVMMLDIQKYTSEQMYYVPGQVGAVGSFISYQKNLRGVLEYQTGGFDQGNETLPFVWKA